MRFSPRRFALPKEGNSPVEYEDASSYNLRLGRLAVADGAGDAYDSGRWARLLVESFTDDVNPPLLPEQLEEWLDAQTEVWASAIDWESLPWYKYDKARLGAFATFLGIEFEPPAEGANYQKWRALAVGDACLFQIRDDELVPPTPFPIADCTHFGNTPPLISTDKAYNQRSLAELRLVQGEYRPGDLFLLATDAFAQWFICACQTGQKPWAVFNQLDEVNLDEFVARLRNDRALRNDDVTCLLVRVKVETSDEATPVVNPDFDHEQINPSEIAPDTESASAWTRPFPTPQADEPDIEPSFSAESKTAQTPPRVVAQQAEARVQVLDPLPAARRSPSNSSGLGSTRLSIILFLTAVDVLVLSLLIVLILRSR